MDVKLQSCSASYLDRIDKVVALRSSRNHEKKQTKRVLVGCPGYFLLGECENEHQYAKEIFCGREWCPVCGVKGLEAHNRRTQRWILKAQKMTHMGYWVFTIPPELRNKYRSKASLNLLSKRMTCGDKSKNICGILKSMGFNRGLSRWHFFGDESPGVYAPHLNVLVDGGRLSPERIEEIKKGWARILGVPGVDAHYGYKEGARKMSSCVSYVTRATFTELNWDTQLAAELFQFHNTKSWGKWQDETKWSSDSEMKRGLEIALVEGKEVCVCPKCQKPIKWVSARDMMWLQIQDAAGGAQYLGSGYWELGDLGLMVRENTHDALYRRLLRREWLASAKVPRS